MDAKVDGCMKEYLNACNQAGREGGRQSYIARVLVVMIDIALPKSYRAPLVLVDTILALWPVDVRGGVGHRPGLDAVLLVDVPV